MNLILKNCFTTFKRFNHNFTHGKLPKLARSHGKSGKSHANLNIN